MDAAVGHAYRFVAPDGFETLGEVVGNPDHADQAALADHGVVPSRPAGELARVHRAAAGGCSSGRASEKFVRTRPAAWTISVESELRPRWASGHHADLLRGVRPSAPAVGLERPHDRQSLAVRETWASVACRGLLVHVEGLLAEIDGAAPEVVDGGLRGEVAQLEAVAPDLSCDLEEAVAVVGTVRTDAGRHGLRRSAPRLTRRPTTGARPRGPRRRSCGPRTCCTSCAGSRCSTAANRRQAMPDDAGFAARRTEALGIVTRQGPRFAFGAGSRNNRPLLGDRSRTEEQLARGQYGPVGWALISRQDVARAEEALAKDDRGVRDEVGFLALHQGLADRFFPGTSVLHTRLRYALFIPWLLEMVAERSGNDFASRFAAAETALAGQLLEQEDPDGVIGGGVWPQPAAQPPSMAYWTALGAWRILRRRPDLSLPTRAQLFRRVAARRRHRAADDEDVPLDDGAAPPFVKLPDRPDELGVAGERLDFDLNQAEREFLRRRLLGVERHGSREPSLLARLADAGVGYEASDPWASEVAEVADDEDRAALAVARGASALAGIGRGVYAALAETAHAGDGLPECGLHRARLAELVEAEGGDARHLDLDALDLLLPGLPDNLRRVLSATRAWLASGRTDPGSLRECYEGAEGARKGDRARLPDTVGGRKRRAEWDPEQHRPAQPLHYRWSNVRRLLADLHRG